MLMGTVEVLWVRRSREKARQNAQIDLGWDKRKEGTYLVALPHGMGVKTFPTRILYQPHSLVQSWVRPEGGNKP
jgi:hypothetical protein